MTMLQTDAVFGDINAAAKPEGRCVVAAAIWNRFLG
jgi:hypothetical protein